MTAGILSETGALIANRNGRAYNLTMSTDQTLVGKNNLTSRLIFFRQVPLFAELTESELAELVKDFARKLLELAQNHGQVEAEGVRVNLTLTQSELASMIGATRESINKALGNFKRQGLIRMEQRHIIIVDPDLLREISS